MLRNLATTLGVAATVLTTTAAVPAAADAQSRYDRSVSSRHAYARNYSARCRHERRSAGNKGTVGGALVGGGAGALIGGGLTAGLIGAGVGAVAGHAIAKHRTHC